MSNDFRPNKWTSLTSDTNERFKSWKTLLTSGGIRKSGAALVSGEKIIRELLEQDYPIQGVLVEESRVDDFKEKMQAEDRRASYADTHFYAVKKSLFNELNENNTPGPIAIIERPKLKLADLSKKPAGLEIILCLQDPNNLGAALRVAEAFESSKVILLKECAEPYLPKALRAASGSTFRMKLEQGPSIKDLIDEIDATSLVTLDLDGKDIRKHQFAKNCRLLLGVEGPGIPEELRDLPKVTKLLIPIADGMDSLNAVSALSIACYAYSASQS